MSNKSYGGIPSDKLYLVRVQAGLEGTTFTNGDLSITRSTKGNLEINPTRNTLHFALNGVVSNHAYGSFNHDFVLVTPLEKTLAKNPGMLAGFNPADTFIHQDENNLVHLHEPILIAPKNSEIPQELIDGGIQVVRYDKPENSSIEEVTAIRDQTVHQVLEGLDAPVKQIGMWGWTDQSMSDFNEEKDFVSNLGYDLEQVATRHDGSIENQIESAYDSLRYHQEKVLEGKERLYDLPSGVQIPHTEMVIEAKSNLQNLISKVPNPVFRSKMNEFFENMSSEYEKQLTENKVDEPVLGTVNSFDQYEDEFLGFNQSSDGADIQPIANTNAPQSIPQNEPSLGAEIPPIDDGIGFTGSEPPPPPPMDYDPFAEFSGGQDQMPYNSFNEPPMDAYMDDVGRDYSSDAQFDALLEEVPTVATPQPEPQGVSNMANPQESSVFEGNTVDLNSLTPQYLLHPKRTMNEIHQAMELMGSAPQDQVQAHFGKWKKQQITDLNTLLTNDARDLFHNTLNEENEGKPLSEQKFKTLSGAWYNTPNGSDSALKGLDATAFKRVPVVEFATIDPKTRNLQQVTRFALQANDPAHPHVAQFLSARADMVSNKADQISKTNAQKLDDLNAQMASAESNGIYTGLEKDGLPLKSALNIVQHPTITGRAEEIKLGEANALDVAPDGLSLIETPKEVFGIRSIDPDNPVPFAEFEAAENDRKRDFAVGMEEGLEISQPTITEKKEAESEANAKKESSEPQKGVTEAKKDDGAKFTPKKTGNGRNNFNRNPENNNGMNFAGGNDGGKKKGNKTDDLVDDLNEKPKRQPPGNNEIQYPSSRYMLEHLLDTIRKILMGLLKLLASILRFGANVGKTAYYSAKLGAQKALGNDTFDTKSKLQNAFMKTTSGLSFDRTNKPKEKRDGKFVATAAMPNGLGDKTIDEATNNKLAELNAKFGKPGAKYDVMSNALASGSVVVESPANAQDIEEFDKKATLDTMFTTSDGQRFVVVGQSEPVEGQPPRLDVIELKDTTIVPIDRNSHEFTRNVTSVSIDEVKEKLNGVSSESKVLSPEIVVSDKRYNTAPERFFSKYPNENQLKIDTSVDVLNDRVGLMMQDKKTGNPYMIVGVDTLVNKDGTHSHKYQAVKMADNTSADLNFLRDAKVETLAPSFFDSKAHNITDAMDPKLKDRLVDLQANGIEIQKNGMGFDVSDLKKLGQTFIEMSNRGINVLTSQEKAHLTNKIDALADKHEAITPTPFKDNIIAFDPAAVTAKLKEKEQQHINDVLGTTSLDATDPNIQAVLNEKMGNFFGKQNRADIPMLSADQEVKPEPVKPVNKAVFALDYSGIDFQSPTLTDNAIKFRATSGVEADNYDQELYIDYEPTTVPLVEPESVVKAIDVDHDVVVENAAFTSSIDSTINYEPTVVQGPLPQVQMLDDVFVNKNINNFTHSTDNTIPFVGVHTGYTADEIPEFEPKDALNEQFANDIWQDGPRGSLTDTVSLSDTSIQLDSQQLELELLIEKPQVTDASFDQLLEDFNREHPIEIKAPTASLGIEKEPEIDWSNDALKLDLTSDASPVAETKAEALIEFAPVEELQNEPVDVAPPMLDPQQEVELDNAIEEIHARIAQDKQQMLQELEQKFDTPQTTAYKDDSVEYMVEQQAQIQKEMAKGPNSVFTGESVPSKLSFSMSELSNMPTMGHSDLIANIYNDDFAEQMQRKALATFANRNPDAKTLDANEVKAVTEHVRLSDAAHLIRLHRDEQNSQNYEQSALFAPGLRSLNNIEGDQNLMSRRNRHEPFEALQQRIIHELEASGNHPATVKFCEDLIQKRIGNEVNKLARGCEATGLQLNKGFSQTISHEQSVRFQDAIKSQFPDTDIKINDLVKNVQTGESLTVVGRRLEDVQLEGGAVSQEERMLVARSFAIGLVGATESISPSQIELQEPSGGRLSNRQIEHFEHLNRVDLNGLNIGSNQTKVDLSNNSELAQAKENILAMLNNPKDHPDDSLACELQGMRDNLNSSRDRFFAVQREVLANPAVSSFMEKVEDQLRKSNINPNIVSNVVPTQNEQGAIVKYDRVVNMDSLNAIREMNTTNKADPNGFYQQTDFAKVLIEANDPKLNAQIAELGRLSKDVANTMGSIDEIRNDMVDRVFESDQQLGQFTNEDITRLHQQVTNDTLSTRDSLPIILGSMAQYSEVANNIEKNRHAPEPVSNDEMVNDGKNKFGNFISKIGSMFKRNDVDAQSQINDKSNEIKYSKDKAVEVKVEVKVKKDKRQDNDNSLSM